MNFDQHRSELIEVDNSLRLRVITWGDSTINQLAPFVLVHGLASNGLLWQGAAVELARLGHRVFAVDLRGHGQSDKPEGGYDVASVANDLARLLQKLAHDSSASAAAGSTASAAVGSTTDKTVESTAGTAKLPIVVGQSWGGNVVLELAHSHGNLVSGVCAVDGGFLDLQKQFADWDTCAEILAPPRLAGSPSAQMLQYMKRAHPDWPQSGIDGAMANFEHLPDGTLRPWLTFERHMLVLRGMWEHSPLTIYNEIKVPVLFVPADGHGGVFANTKRAAVETALAMVQNSRVEWFSPADHDLHAQYPERFAKVLHAATVNGFFK